MNSSPEPESVSFGFTCSHCGEEFYREEEEGMSLLEEEAWKQSYVHAKEAFEEHLKTCLGRSKTEREGDEG